MSKIENIKIEDVWCNMKDERQCIVIAWNSYFGWGEITIYRDSPDSEWEVDSERMSNNEDKEFIRSVMNAWIDSMNVSG